MMSQSHPQPPQCLKQLIHEHPESSLSSSQTVVSSCPIQFQASTAAASSSLSIISSQSSFAPKLFSSSHQYFNERHSPPFSCCFNVSSKRWGTLKLGCSDASSMASQVEFSVRSPSEIVSLFN
ncbi:hypothetical protein L6164_022000 [Bauhinia variegata]|uniref:Uncharacterized protein n=1 Tax=Bauhinia variegata TaxID=167791 RepID=A0ACB9MDJ8_BAUVA|nr:hypothetical protein L6164_022000 [Bauhinia variegata]